LKNVEKKNRAAYSSPALFNLERIMQSFRARSQLLVERIEENDFVLQRKFNSTFDIEKENDSLIQEINSNSDSNGNEDLEDLENK
jgi:hypothetical protein